YYSKNKTYGNSSAKPISNNQTTMRRGYNRGRSYSPRRIPRSSPRTPSTNYNPVPKTKTPSYPRSKLRTEHYRTQPIKIEPDPEQLLKSLEKGLDEKVLDKLLERLEEEFERLETDILQDEAKETDLIEDKPQILQDEAIPIELPEEPLSEVPSPEVETKPDIQIEEIFMEIDLEQEPESWQIESSGIVESLVEQDSGYLEPIDIPQMDIMENEPGPEQLEDLVEPLYEMEPILDQIDLNEIGLMEPVQELYPFEPIEELPPLEPAIEPKMLDPIAELEPLPEGEVEIF
ncbi:hypothetical protein ACFL0D_07310, partial [Thermoproteota archaeon]